MTEFSEFVLWGSSGHAKVLAELISLRGGRVLALFDNTDVSSSITGVPVFRGERGFRTWLDDRGSSAPELAGLVAIGGGRGADRLKIQCLFQECGILIPSICHPSAVVSRSAKLGVGVQVMSLVNIDPHVSLGDACLVNKACSISHDSKIGNGVHLAPGSIVLGEVEISDNVFIGAGAIILPRLKIGKGAIIGAGSVVRHDIPSGTTVVGNPGRQIVKSEAKK